MSSILNDIKHKLGLFPGDTQFDSDIISEINSAFFTLNQLGVGPIEGYAITSAADKWEDFSRDVRLNGVQTYVYLKTKLVFDPPQTGFALAAMERQLDELGQRLNWVADYG